MGIPKLHRGYICNMSSHTGYICNTQNMLTGYFLDVLSMRSKRKVTKPFLSFRCTKSLPFCIFVCNEIEWLIVRGKLKCCVFPTARTAFGVLSSVPSL